MILQQPTLVLNAQWHPVSTITVQDAITMLCGGFADSQGKTIKAKVLDTDTWQALSWDEWEKMPPKEGEPLLRGGSNKQYRVPHIIVATRYQKIPKNQLNFNKRNLFRRDQDICQYCGCKGDTMDHIIPKTKGGKSSWENCVVACFDCNQKKKDHTIEEAQMRLLRKPCKPGLEILGMSKIRHESWEMFLKKQGS